MVGDRLRSWAAPLERHRRRLDALRPELLVVQLGGPAGSLAALGPAAEAVRRALATRLGLADAPQWHSQRDRIAALGSALAGIAGSLGKFGQDVALMAQAGDEIALAGGGGSSAMPHKQNPVAAEMLVALARFAAVQLSGLHQALVHEQERSGAAWTLEWLLLPPLLLATGAATRIAGELAGGIVRPRSPLEIFLRVLSTSRFAIRHQEESPWRLDKNRRFPCPQMHSPKPSAAPRSRAASSPICRSMAP